MALKLGLLELGDLRQGKLCGDKESVRQNKQPPATRRTVSSDGNMG